MTDEARELIKRIAAVAIWRDRYPDGPDIMDEHFALTPRDVRACRAFIERTAALGGQHGK